MKEDLQAHRSLEEIKESIKEKQALLFEQRLESYLQIEDPTVSSEEKKKAFLSMLEIDKFQKLQEEGNKLGYKSNQTLPNPEEIRKLLYKYKEDVKYLKDLLEKYQIVNSAEKTSNSPKSTNSKEKKI